MKYNTKTAVHVTDEFTRENLIEFFEAIKSDCKEEYQWTIDNVRLNRVCYIDEYGYLEGWDIDNFKSRYPDYTIIEGIPQNWREEMKTPKLINVEVADQYQGLFNLLSKEHGLTLTISEMDEIVIESAKISESKINQLENENKELRECLYGMILYAQVHEVTSVIYSEGRHGELIERSKKLFPNNF